MAAPFATSNAVPPGPGPVGAGDYDPRTSLDALLGPGVTVEAAPGQTIIVEGDPIRNCYRILSGGVRLYKAIADGRRQVIDFLVPGDSFGLIGRRCYPYSVEAISPTTLVRYPRIRIDAAVKSDPVVAMRLFELACLELERAQRQMLLLGRKSADEKIASFLLALAERLNKSDKDLLHLPMSRQDMADYLGLTIETVSRTFSRLRREGLIELATPHDVVLAQLESLRALGDGLE
jgi:CRP/FNR family transcriptional regulator